VKKGGGMMEYGVLVVDDEASVLNTVKKILKSADIKVKTACGGKECLVELHHGFRGLILMDIVMPGMDGWETIHEIVDGGFADRVIICMLTGENEPDHKMDPLKEYVVDYITKPFNIHQLVSLVREYLSYLG